MNKNELFPSIWNSIKRSKQEMHLDFLRFFLLYDNMKVVYTIYLIPMENNITVFSKELLQMAVNCLSERDTDIDHLVDLCQWDYQTAQISILTKYVCNGDIAQAEQLFRQIQEKNTIKEKRLLEQREVESLGSFRQVQEARSVTDFILSDPYASLVEQLTFSYKCFCKEHNLDTNMSIPEIFKDIIIFRFSKTWEKGHEISFWRAHSLLKPDAKLNPRQFFISATL